MWYLGDNVTFINKFWALLCPCLKACSKYVHYLKLLDQFIQYKISWRNFFLGIGKPVNVSLMCCLSVSLTLSNRQSFKSGLGLQAKFRHLCIHFPHWLAFLKICKMCYDLSHFFMSNHFALANDCTHQGNILGHWSEVKIKAFMMN